MSRRARFIVVTAVALAAAVGVGIGAALVGGSDGSGDRPSGVPPYVLDLGVRQDSEAQALRRAGLLFRAGHHAESGRVLAGYDSLQAQIGRSLAKWPDDSLAELERLAREHPESGAVLFHLGLARFWSGDRDGALAAWREARARDPDSVYAVRADDLLYREFAPGLPTFIPAFKPDPTIARLDPARQLAALERAARRRDVHAKLLYGLALQRIERPASARREFAAAARLAPRDPEALVADAVGRFDKANPSLAFSRLGPLARRYPQSPSVRFHLGLLLLWIGRPEDAKRQLTLASRAKRSVLAREARRLLTRLEDVRKPQ
jgi:tetratricopeptide (TPR) repeat protein